MKFKGQVASFVIGGLSASLPIFADTTYDAKSVMSDEQLDAIVKTMTKIAPSGTKITNLTFRGFFTVNEERYITGLDVNAISFKLSTKVGIIPLTDNVTISLAGTFPTLDCDTPTITRISTAGTNALMDGLIKDHITKNVLSIFRDNFIAQSDLVKYCKYKPKPHMTSPLNLQFDELQFENIDYAAMMSEDEIN